MAGRGIPITVKLPLLIGGLVVVVTAIYGGATYQTVRRSTAAAVSGRLGTVVDQLALTLRASRGQLLAATRTVADSAAVRAYVLHPGDRLRAAAAAALRPTGVLAQQVAAVELWSTDRRRLLAVGDADRWGDVVAAAELLQQAAGTDSGAVGAFRAAGDSIAYPVAAPVVTGGRTSGYVVQWRRIASSPDTREQNSRLNRLIGSDAHLFIGDTSGGVWTDLSRRVPPPPAPVTHRSGVVRYDRPGAGPVLAAARLVPQTPWVVLVEFPAAAVSAPARQFLGRLILIGAFILVVGLGAAWAAARTVTGPLARLTRTAEAVAAGDYSQPVTERPRGDELGRLAAAFDVMVAHVRESQQRLEERVRARTARSCAKRWSGWAAAPASCRSRAAAASSGSSCRGRVEPRDSAR